MSISGSRVFDGGLIVESSLRQASGPGVIRIGEDSFFFISQPVAVLLIEEVGIGILGVGDGCFGNIFRVGLNCFERQGLHARDLIADWFFGVAVAIVIDQRGGSADLAHIVYGLHTGVTASALIDSQLERMLVMAVLARVHRADMVEQSVVLLASILVATLLLWCRNG